MITAERLRDVLDYDPETGVFTWRVRIGPRVKVGGVAGVINYYGHRVICIDRKQYYAHRLAWMYVNGVMPPDEIDHINKIPDDNRICNIRCANRSQNNSNRSIPSHNTSGCKGVHWQKKRQKWRAQIGINGKTVVIGDFDSKTDAASAYCEAANRLHGEFARFA